MKFWDIYPWMGSGNIYIPNRHFLTVTGITRNQWKQHYHRMAAHIKVNKTAARRLEILASEHGESLGKAAIKGDLWK